MACAPVRARRRKGMCWNTRADDLAVKATIGLMERNAAVPADRIDDVAIAATSQTGDQGLTLGRSVAILAGLPRRCPDSRWSACARAR